MVKSGLSRAGTFLLYLLSLLPFWLLYFIADILFISIYYVFGYRKKVVAENIRNSFPEKPIAERKIIEKKYYRYLADLIVETVKCTTIRADEIKRRIYVTNPEMMHHYFNQGKNIIATTAHYGNWEMAALIFGQLTDKQRLIVFKPLSNTLFNDFLNRNRSRFGATMVPMKQTLRKIVEVKNELSCLMLVADQSPARNEVHHFTTFLNQPTAVFTGAEKLSRFINGVVVFFKIDLVKRGYYKATLIPLVENSQEAKPYEITEKYIQCIEGIIKEKPEYWLWSHRRWKIKPGNIVNANINEQRFMEKTG